MLFYENLSEYRRSEMARLERLTEANIPDRGVIAKVLLPRPVVQEAGAAGYAVARAQLRTMGRISENPSGAKPTSPT